MVIEDIPLGDVLVLITEPFLIDVGVLGLSTSDNGELTNGGVIWDSIAIGFEGVIWLAVIEGEFKVEGDFVFESTGELLNWEDLGKLELLGKLG
ncbi:hypothetical protein HDV01_003138 [Terramyces sp. JEL0728]|nr:hypothetical protein HDV01_003138 [Terramyces sp. JEL0728]